MTRFADAARFNGVALLLASALSACAAPDPRDEFGYSVRHMIGTQIYNPAAATNPSVQPPQPLAGDKAAQAMKAYRGDKPLGATEKTSAAAAQQ